MIDPLNYQSKEFQKRYNDWWARTVNENAKKERERKEAKNNGN